MSGYIVTMSGNRSLIIGQWLPSVIPIVLAIIALLTFFTTAQRLFHAWRSLTCAD